MEALIGAIYLRKGYNFTKKRVLKLIERFTNIEEFLAKDEDYKSFLYQWTQKNKKSLEFKSVELKEEMAFEVSLFIDDKFIAKSTASNKKTAEKEVSRQAIKLLEIS
jgi:ribonuclease-3